MFTTLAKLALSRDPAALCRVVSEAMTTDSILGAGIIAAIEANSPAVLDQFIKLAELNEAEAELARDWPFLWVPGGVVDGGAPRFGLIATGADHLGRWGLHTIDELKPLIVRGAAVDPYDSAVRRQSKTKLKVVK